MYHLAKSLYMHWTSKEEYSILLLGLDNAGKTTLLSQIKNLYPSPSSDGPSEAKDSAGNTVPTVGQNVATIDLPNMYLKIWDVGGQQSLRKLWNSYYESCHAVVFVVDSSDVGGGALPEGEVNGGGGYLDSNGGGGTTGGTRHSRRKSRASFVGGAEEADAELKATKLEKDRQQDEADERSLQTPLTPFTPFSPLGADQQYGRLPECRLVLESILSAPAMAGIPILVLANKQDREDCVEVVRIKEGFVRKVFEGEKGGMVRDSRVLPVSALRGTGVREAVEWVRSRVVWNKEGRAPVMR